MTKAIAIPLIVKRIAIFYTVFESEEGIPSRGLVHPRTRVGGGARWLAVHEVDEADSGRGRNDGDARSMPGMTEWSPPGGYPFLRPPYSTTVTNSLPGYAKFT